MTPIKVYLAAPFFTQAQVDKVAQLENLLAGFSCFEIFSPRKMAPVLKDLTPAERKTKSQEVFDSNIAGMDRCDMMLAWTDDYDFGVGVELGYLYGHGTAAIVGYTEAAKGMNVMAAHLMDTYCTGITELLNLLTTINNDGFIALTHLTNKQAEVIT